jgi:NADH dehydrogenase/putative oxidoreductase
MTSYRGGRPRVQLAALLDIGGTMLRVAAPVVDLVIRLSLAKAFFAPGMLPGSHSMQSGASWPLIAALLLGPLLLAAGLFVRLVALLMLILTLLAQFGAPQDVHLFWAALFGWYVVRGAGPLSLDYALAKGLAHSALPLANWATEAAGWVDREIAPFYLLVLRLWLAAAVTGIASAHAMLPAAMLPVAMLPAAMLPAMEPGMLPPAVAIVGAILLVAGLATPLVAAVLCLIGLIGYGAAMAGAGQAVSIYEPLVLALLAVHGAGRHSVDWLIGRWAHHTSPIADDAPHIVIVGAGFGGMSCAAGLRHERARVTLIDRHNYHLFQPLLYQVATGALSPADIAAPIRGAFRDDAAVRVLCGTVTAVDTANRHVVVDGRNVAYDALVLATGATHGYFGHEEWAAYAPGLKSVQDATSIRSRILDAFEQAEAADDPAARQRLLTFLICGAGPTGVELAGAIAELSRNGMTKDFRNFDPASARILLVQAGPRVLPSFDERISAFARSSLEALGVEVRVNSRVEIIDDAGVAVNGERITAGTVLWAAGVVASPAAQWLGAEADRAGRVQVGADLSVPGFPDIFAIGDTSLALAWEGQPAPGLAPAAKQEGAYVAAVLHARLHNRRAPPPFRYKHQGSLATIGRKSAVADFGRLKLTGAVAWWLWGAVHVLFLLGVRNRVAVMLGWAWSYFTFDIGVRLIEDEGPHGLAPGGAAAPAEAMAD